MVSERDFSGFVFRTVPSEGLTTADREHLFGLFDACYRQANHAYLEDSLERLRYVSLSLRDETPVGFALAEVRIMDLPRLPQATVILGGLSCVLPEFRRQGLVARMGLRNIVASAVRWGERGLVCGRAAHPAGFRVFVRNETVVPKLGTRPTPWQGEVGRAIADAYGVVAFDPQTFVCTGTGKPIGYPIMDMEVNSQEWELFRPVDRDRGDSLLGMVWIPDAPPGW